MGTNGRVKAAALAVCVTLTGACSGDGSGEQMSRQAEPTQIYTPYASTANVVSQLGGAVVETTSLNTSFVTGSRAHLTNANALSSPASTSTITLLTDLPTNYDYVRQAAFNDGPNTYQGVIGVRTNSVDVQNAANATYVGEFEGGLIAGGLETLADWSAVVSADFVNKLVDTNFTGSGSTQIDEIRMENANIIGTTFSGGAITTLNGGATVNVTGGSGSLKGSFFGYNTAISAPAEVGGVISSSNGVNTLTGAFIAR